MRRYVRPFPSHPTRTHPHRQHTPQVRRLFDDFDIRKVRSLDMETFVAGFRRLNVGFSSATVQDLFEKADTNQDRVVSLGEFQRFGEMYPTMVDCVYYRAKDYWTEVAQKDAVEEAKRLLDELRSREAAARAAHAAAQQETDAADHKLQTQVQIVADAQSREVAAKVCVCARLLLLIPCEPRHTTSPPHRPRLRLRTTTRSGHAPSCGSGWRS